MKRLLIGLVVLGTSGIAWADTVYLHTGASFEGIVTEAGDRVTVTMDFGTVTFRRVDVERIVLSRAPLQEFLEKAKRVETIAQKLDLAEWATVRQLDSHAKGLYQDIVRTDPENAAARAALGYRRVDGRWLTEEEEMTSRGFVRLDGAWVSKAEIEERRRRLEVAVAEQKRQAELAEARARVDEARSIAEQARQEAEELRRRLDAMPRVIVRYRCFWCSHELDCCTCRRRYPRVPIAPLAPVAPRR